PRHRERDALPLRRGVAPARRRRAPESVTAGLPGGLVYRPDFLTFDEEGRLLELLDALEFEPIVMRGVTARRTALRFGDDVPGWLAPLRDRGAALAGLDPHALVQALVQRYPPGAPIGWHR